MLSNEATVLNQQPQINSTISVFDTFLRKTGGANKYCWGLPGLREVSCHTIYLRARVKWSMPPHVSAKNLRKIRPISRNYKMLTKSKGSRISAIQHQQVTFIKHLQANKTINCISEMYYQKSNWHSALPTQKFCLFYIPIRANEAPYSELFNEIN